MNSLEFSFWFAVADGVVVVPRNERALCSWGRCFPSKERGRTEAQLAYSLRQVYICIYIDRGGSA